MPLLRTISCALTAAIMSVAQAQGGEFITVASTTSTENSGLFGHILPLFEAETGIEVRVVAQGTGQALETGRRGDADVVLVHARAAEEKFVSEGYGVERYDIMYNDFVIVGPTDDPAEIAGSATAIEALEKISQTEVPFASRGDDSGTNKAELRLWDAAGIEPQGDWYRETGSGMGATLNTAAQMPAYTISDRGTWISFENKAGLEILHQGDPNLFNPYGVILVDPKMHPHVKADAGEQFIDWLRSEPGQAAISEYQIDGQQLFFANSHGS